MNDTKWRELCTAVADLPFPPAYQVKTLEEKQPYPLSIDIAPSYWGDWGRTPEAELGSHIEWIKIAPKYKRHVGMLVAPTIEDCSTELRAMLKKLQIPYVESKGFFILYAQASGTGFDYR